MNNTVTVHKHFTMGQAPYRYIGLWSAPSSAVQEANPEAYNLAMKGKPYFCNFSCDHCGMSIKNHAMIVDATGKRFAIGCDCLVKLHEVKNMTKLEADKRAHQRKLRQARNQLKREERQKAAEAEAQVERDANGGLTNREMELRIELETLAAEQNTNFDKYIYFIKPLMAQRGDFCGSMFFNFLRGHVPTGRASTIVLEIAAKYYSGASRAYGKAFDAAYEAAEDELLKIA